MDKNTEQLNKEILRMSRETGIKPEICRAMLIIGERNTRRDAEGRLLADPEDIEDALLDGDEVFDEDEE